MILYPWLVSSTSRRSADMENRKTEIAKQVFRTNYESILEISRYGEQG
jgi:hypothetical protein